ncbi:MAG: hypothetical protein IJ396_05630 [Oscillibacter sp.]|nr:hypothetical protein [Oscillibacter sp.]
MENYINIFGQRIELTTDQVEELRKSLGASSSKLANVAVADTFKIGQREFVVLEQSGDTTTVILKDLLHDSVVFGSNNNYDGSNVDGLCGKFAEEISAVVGSKNLVEHTVDLTSDDGLRDYGKVKRRMSLLTADLYRRYVDILDAHKIEKWWWLARSA